MILKLNETEHIDTDRPIDISIPIHNGNNPVLAWYCDPIKLEPVITDRFIGDVTKGGSVNFRNLFMNPHAHGTHTECLGHISKEWYSINKCLKQFHFYSLLISVQPETIHNDLFQQQDQVITSNVIESALAPFMNDVVRSRAIIIRTLPNQENKLSTNYSNTNPVYLDRDAVELINKLDFDHLIIDQPSIDREEDGGELIGHHTFWKYPEDPQIHKTITELVYVPNEVKDGCYFLNIQITSLENDASPSKLVLFEINN